MKWSIAELHRYSDEPLHIQTTLDLNQILTTSFRTPSWLFNQLRLMDMLVMIRGMLPLVLMYRQR